MEFWPRSALPYLRLHAVSLFHLCVCVCVCAPDFIKDNKEECTFEKLNMTFS